MEVLDNRSIVTTADSKGRVQFTSWTNRAPIDSVKVAGEQLTSLDVSPDGTFMAIGDSDASMSLWELRVLDVPMLFTRPFAQAQPVHLVGVGTLAQSANLPPRVQHALQFYRTCLAASLPL